MNNDKELVRVARLDHLCDVLGAVKPNQLGMGSWRCGTSACAVGHACLDKEFNEQGLHLTYVGHSSTTPCPVFGEAMGWDAVESFFGLSLDEAEWLFSTCYPTLGSDDITPQMVIARIRKLLETGQVEW